MKKIIIIISMFPALFACRSVDFPKPETSQRQIDSLKPLIEKLDVELTEMNKNMPSGREFIMHANIKPFNEILSKIAFQRDDDLELVFNESKGIISEQKSLLGINYTNQIDVLGGKLDVNLKSFKFESIENNKIIARIELESKGKISVAGKYMGAPAQISPDVQLYLNEEIAFSINGAKPGMITLVPDPKQLALKTKISFNLLGWSVPFYKEVPLQINELIKPIEFPVALKSDINFPLPAQTFGESKIEFAPYILDISSPEIWAWGNKIEYKVNIDFTKKK